MSTLSKRGLAWTGFLLAPIAWAASTQMNYALTSWSCQSYPGALVIVAVICLAVALGSGVLASRALSHSDGQDDRGRAANFIAAIGGLSALLFSLAILLQAAAAIILNGCQR